MNRTLKKILFLSAGISVLIPTTALAKSSGGLGLGITPVVGYERVQKVLPTPHTNDRLTYGLRMTAGVPLLSLEVEATRGQDTEIFTNPDMTVKDTTDKVKVGARFTFDLGRLLAIGARGGVQAKRTKSEITLSGTTTTTTSPITYKPYGGGTLRAMVSNNTSIDGSVTVIFNDFPDMKQNEYEATLGFTLRFP